MQSFQIQANRDVCLIPLSAHGTNPASAQMAGMKVVPINVDEDGSISMDDLTKKAEKYADDLGKEPVVCSSHIFVF